jgi:alkylation response protein AidB-like acyl-CoA dehydrogenase
VPVANLVAREGDGWAIAKFLLSNERVAIADTGPKLRLAVKIGGMLADARDRLAPALQAALIQQLAAAETRLIALCALEEDYIRAWNDGASQDGPQASVLKVLGTEVLQQLSEIALRVEGPFGAVHDPADLHRSRGPAAEQQASAMAHQYLYGRCWSIFGGTNEIQRTLIARAILR